MARILVVIAMLAFAGFMPAGPAAAQNNTIGGAIIGGGIGAAAGAAIGSQLEPRRGGYYWYNGNCWRKHRDGSYHRVSRRYC